MADSIKSVDVPSVHGMVALNPDGSAIGTPVGGATAANQTDGSQKTQIVDAGGEVATVTGGKLDVNATASLAGESIPATGATTAVSVQVVDGSGNQISSFGGGTQYADGAARGTATGTIAMGDDGTNIQSVHVDSSGDLQIDVLSSALPTGAATAANQQTDALTDTQLRATAVDVSVSTMPTTNVAQSGSWSVDLGNINGIATETTVAAIDTKTPALGQALAAASVPVVLPAAQITAITPPAAITGFATAANQLPDGHNVTVDNASLAVTGTFWQATQPVSGTVTANATLAAETTKVIGTVNIASAQTLATVTTVGAVTAITNALPAGTNAIGKLAANSGVDIGDVDVTSISAGTNLIGDVDIAPRTTGGWSVANFTSGDTYTALTNSAQVIKASAGKFGGYYIYNPNATAAYVMVYDIAAASVTVGTSTPKLVFCIPAGGGANLEIMAGIPFGTALSCAAATTGAGNTAPTTALEAMIWYK